jgi:UDP-perosamine 4-acetyltransferase
MIDLIIIGTGGHARSCLDVLAETGFAVRGCVGGAPTGRLQANYLGTDDVLARLRDDGVDNALVAVGDNRLRRKLTNELTEMGFRLPAVVSRHAVVSATATVEDGSIVMHGAVVGPFSRVGRGVIVNTSASVDHDCVVDDFAHLAPGTHLAGEVRIGAGAFLGIGSAAVPGVSAGDWSVVGAGATIISDIPSATTAIGTPARRMRKHHD